ncbi:MAG: substrate-binding domain-containing protein [Planctomycetota bacterium]|nr:substrate-binding domain-containing protein [Planctomycetota bacterium]
MFYAPCYSPIFDGLRDECEKVLGVRIVSETDGSLMLCRKVSELGKECDLLMVSDSEVLKEVAGGWCRWRLDFASDEVVIGVGVRARRVDEAERDWVSVLVSGDVRFGRVDENLGPAGYRTLLVWALEERRRGVSGLALRLKERCVTVVEDAGRLAALLKVGGIDYGFLYRTLCLEYDIRYIELDRKVNLGSQDEDYGGVEVSFKKLKAGEEQIVRVKGSAITYGLTVPEGARNREKAIALIKYLLTERRESFISKGYRFFKPRFYGTREEYERFAGFAEYAGEF